MRRTLGRAQGPRARAAGEGGTSGKGRRETGETSDVGMPAATCSNFSSAHPLQNAASQTLQSTLLAQSVSSLRGAHPSKVRDQVDFIPTTIALQSDRMSDVDNAALNSARLEDVFREENRLLLFAYACAGCAAPTADKKVEQKQDFVRRRCIVARVNAASPDSRPLKVSIKQKKRGRSKTPQASGYDESTRALLPLRPHEVGSAQQGRERPQARRRSTERVASSGRCRTG